MTLLEKAIKATKYSNVKRAKVAAIAFSHSGEIITTSHNRRVMGQKGKFTQHAEEVLIHKLNRIKAWDRFENITILVIRVNTKGIVMAKPCIKCQALLKRYPIKIMYTDSVGVIQHFK